MPGLMIQFHHPHGTPTLAQAAVWLDVSQAALDSSFGVIATDPQEHLYTVLIEAAAADSALGAIRRHGASHPAEGAYGNARIAPMDEPER
ncbi:hypothetical protein ABC347_01925 [Sphingomonas sp. 1P06PA]|uniref:hypothetical protein n=1 Tax=Sphingomonas sp. 1P06PA TaxID=554121 RepID=UPI0039A4B478